MTTKPTVKEKIRNVLLAVREAPIKHNVTITDKGLETLTDNILSIMQEAVMSEEEMWNIIIGNSTLVHKDIRQFEALGLAKAIREQQLRRLK